MAKINVITEGLPKEINDVLVDTFSAKYVQKSDINDEYQELSVSVEDSGEGSYLIISTDRWAIDDIEELVEVLNDFKGRIK